MASAGAGRLGRTERLGRAPALANWNLKFYEKFGKKRNENENENETGFSLARIWVTSLQGPKGIRRGRIAIVDGRLGVVFVLFLSHSILRYWHRLDIRTHERRKSAWIKNEKWKMKRHDLKTMSTSYLSTRFIRNWYRGNFILRRCRRDVVATSLRRRRDVWSFRGIRYRSRNKIDTATCSSSETLTCMRCDAINPTSTGKKSLNTGTL